MLHGANAGGMLGDMHSDKRCPTSSCFDVHAHDGPYHSLQQISQRMHETQSCMRYDCIYFFDHSIFVRSLHKSQQAPHQRPAALAPSNEEPVVLFVPCIPNIACGVFSTRTSTYTSKFGLHQWRSRMYVR